MAHLTHDQLVAAISAGGSVLYEGRLITRREDLPTSDELTANENQTLVVNASGGPGIDTTAVHVGQTTTGSATLTGDIAAATAHVGGQAVPGPGIDTTAVHRLTDGNILPAEPGNAALGGGLLTSDITCTSLVVNAYAEAVALAAVLGTGAVGVNLTPGVRHYTVTALSSGGETAGVAVTITVPSPAVPVRLSWRADNGVEPNFNGWNIYRADGAGTVNLMDNVYFPAGQAHTWTDDGSQAPNTGVHPPAGNTTGNIAAAGAVLSHNRPVVELGAIAAGTITADKTITVYDASGAAYKIPAVLA